MKDPHDPREFRQWLSFNADGTVAAVHEFHASLEQPMPGLVETTDLYPADYAAVQVDPALVAQIQPAPEPVVAEARVVALTVETPLAPVSPHAAIKVQVRAQVGK